MDSLLRDLRHAARGLAARPLYTAIVIGTLTLVIGAVTSVLAVVNAAIIRPLPIPGDDRIAQLFLMPPNDAAWGSRNPQSWGTFLRFRQRARTTELIEGLWARDRAVGGDDAPEVVPAAGVSPGLFALFGGVPSIGRTFSEAEDQADARVVVLGESLWRRRFDANPAVVGATIQIDREPYEVIGVMPASFRTGFVDTVMWTPLNATEGKVLNGSTFIQTFARRRPDATVAAVQAELTALMPDVAAEAPAVLTGWTPLAVGLRDAQFRQLRGSILALAGGVGALLLLASANLANVMFAEVLARRSQFALRAALGGRAAVLRLQLMETLVVGTAGAVAGLLAGRWALPLLVGLDPSLARTFDPIAIDWRVQVAAVSATLVVVMASGLVPAWRLLRGDLVKAMGSGGRRSVGSRADRRLRSVLVAAECALSVALLAGAALLLNGFDRASRVNPGFDPRSVFAGQLRISERVYPTEVARWDLVSRTLDRIRAVPGVEDAGITLNRFVPGFFMTSRVVIENRPSPDGQPYVAHFRRITPGYFSTMRIPVLNGRDFADSDTPDQLPVAIVSRQFAEKYWPGEDPIGRRLQRGSNPRLLVVVGVAGDVRDVSLPEPPAATVYVPFSQNNVTTAPIALVVRTAGAPLSLTTDIRRAVWSVDPQQPVDSVTTLEQFLADSLGPQRFRSALLLILGGIGLALAALGVYGVTARDVAERTPELGLRVALGAAPSALGRLVVWQSLRVVLAGLAVGVALAAALAAVMLKMLPDLDAGDAWAVVPAVAILAVVAVVAAAIPSRRAVSLAPVAALRLGS
jgi:putative ABC transport system permease protein